MRAILLAAVLGLAVGLFSLGNSSGMGAGDQLPCTVTVQPGESIQAAIDKAEEGAVICLAEGTWEENLVIGKGLTLRGLGPEKSVIKGVKEGEPVILITSDAEIGVIVEGLTIAEAKGWCYEWLRCPNGLSLGGKVKAIIKGNTISGNSNGISMLDSAQAYIWGNTISENLLYYGIWMSDSAKAYILWNTISGNHGIGIEGSAQAYISGNTISENGNDGIYMRESAQATIEGNIISGNWSGIYMGGSAQATIEGNIISGNKIGGSGGIWMSDSAKASILWNTISGNQGFGICICIDSAQASISGNTISENKGGGIEMYGQATIQGNIILGNGELGRAYSAGIVVGGPAQATISENIISGNKRDGILLGVLAQATIEGNKITENNGYGVALYLRPCWAWPTEEKFEGAVRGRVNEISGNKKGKGEPWGRLEVCPAELEFLMTEAGGCYGPKCW
jgi:parallel beta-helix repeat protein